MGDQPNTTTDIATPISTAVPSVTIASPSSSPISSISYEECVSQLSNERHRNEELTREYAVLREAKTAEDIRLGGVLKKFEDLRHQHEQTQQSLVNARDAAQVADARYQASLHDITQMRRHRDDDKKQIIDLMNDKITLTQQLTTLQAQLSSLTTSKDDHSDELKSLRYQYTTLTNDHTLLQKSNDDTRKQLADAHQQLSSLRTTCDHDRTLLTKTQRDLLLMIEEKSQMAKEGQAKEEMRVELDDMKAKLLAAQQEIASNRIYIKNAQSRSVDLQRRLDTHQRNHALSSSAAIADHERATERIRQLEDEADERNVQLAKETTRAIRAVEEADEWKKLLTDTRHKGDIAAKQNRVLQEQVVKLKRELNDIIEEAAGVEQKNIEARSALVQLDEATAELARSQQKEEQVRRDLLRLQEERDLAASRAGVGLAELSKQLRITQTDWQTKVAVAIEEKDKFALRLKVVETALVTRDNEIQERGLKIRSLEDELSVLRGRVRELESINGDITDSNQLLSHELTVEKQRVVTISDTLARQQVASSRQLTEIEQLRVTLHDMDHNNRHRDRDLTDIKHRADDLKTESAFFQKQHARLQMDIDTLKADAIQSANAHAATSASLTHALDELHALKDELSLKNAHVCAPLSWICSTCHTNHVTHDKASVSPSPSPPPPPLSSSLATVTHDENDNEVKRPMSLVSSLLDDAVRSSRESRRVIQSLTDDISVLQYQIAHRDGWLDARTKLIDDAKVIYHALRPRIGLEVNEAPSSQLSSSLSILSPHDGIGIGSGTGIGVHGVRVSAIAAHTPAHHAGLLVDDIILMIDYVPITGDIISVRHQLSQYRPAQMMKLMVLRHHHTIMMITIDVGAIRMTREQLHALRRCAHANVTMDDIKVAPWTITIAHTRNNTNTNHDGHGHGHDDDGSDGAHNHSNDDAKNGKASQSNGTISTTSSITDNNGSDSSDMSSASSLSLSSTPIMNDTRASLLSPVTRSVSGISRRASISTKVTPRSGSHDDRKPLSTSQMRTSSVKGRPSSSLSSSSSLVSSSSSVRGNGMVRSSSSTSSMTSSTKRTASTSSITNTNTNINAITTRRASSSLSSLSNNSGTSGGNGSGTSVSSLSSSPSSLVDGRTARTRVISSSSSVKKTATTSTRSHSSSAR